MDILNDTRRIELKTISVRNFDKYIWDAGLGRAKTQGLTMAAYLQQLILKDLEDANNNGQRPINGRDPKEV